MNVSIFSKMAYENNHNWTLGENKPNSNPIKANFRQKIPTMPKMSKMPYLPSCIKRHYAGTFKAMQPKTCHKRVAILVMWSSRINRRVFYFDSLCGFVYSIGCFVARLTEV